MTAINIQARNKDGSFKRPQLHGPSRAAAQALRALGEVGSTNKWRSTRKLIRRMALLGGVKPSMLSSVTKAARKERHIALGLNPYIDPALKVKGKLKLSNVAAKIQALKNPQRQSSIPVRSMREKVGGFFKRMLPRAFKGVLVLGLLSGSVAMADQFSDDLEVCRSVKPDPGMWHPRNRIGECHNLIRQRMEFAKESFLALTTKEMSKIDFNDIYEHFNNTLLEYDSKIVKKEDKLYQGQFHHDDLVAGQAVAEMNLRQEYNDWKKGN